MPPLLLFLFMIIAVGRILGSPTIKDVNHDELTLSAVGPADPTLEDHFGIVWDTSKTPFIKTLLRQAKQAELRHPAKRSG